MTTKAFLGSNTGVQDIFFFGTQLSPFAYKGWTTSTNFIIERKDYKPMAIPAERGNCNVTFQYPIDTDLAGPPAIIIRLPRIVMPAENSVAARGGAQAVDAGGAYAGEKAPLNNFRYIEGAGLHIIEEVVISYGSNRLQVIKPEDLEIRANLYEQAETLQYTKELMGWYGNEMQHNHDRGEAYYAGEPADPERDSILRTYIVHLPTVFWGLSPNQWLPTFLVKDINQLRIDVKLKDIRRVMTCDSSVSTATHICDPTPSTGIAFDPTTPLGVELRCVNVHLSAMEKQYFSNLAGSLGTREGTEDDGLLYKFQEVERHERIIVPANSKKFVLNLTNFRSPTTQLIFILRPMHKVDNMFPYTASTTVSLAEQRQDPTQDSYKPITYNKVVANSYDLCHRLSWRDTCLSDMLLYYPNGFKKDIYVRVLNDLTPTDELNCVGSINFMNLNNPTLELEWLGNDVPKVPMYLDVYAKVHQVIQMVNGQLHRLFN